jgi:hypothetical protein
MKIKIGNFKAIAVYVTKLTKLLNLFFIKKNQYEKIKYKNESR